MRPSKITGVDRDFSIKIMGNFLTVHAGYATDLTIALDQCTGRHVLKDFHTAFAGVIHHHCIEHVAGNLPCLGARMIQMFVKVKGLRLPSIAADKPDAVFFGKVRRPHLLDHADALEREIIVRNHGLADFITRELLSFD